MIKKIVKYKKDSEKNIIPPEDVILYVGDKFNLEIDFSEIVDLLDANEKYSLELNLMDKKTGEKYKYIAGINDNNKVELNLENEITDNRAFYKLYPTFVENSGLVRYTIEPMIIKVRAI